MEDIEDVFIEAGFKQVFTKPDPRGADYGYFEAELGSLPGTAVEVNHCYPDGSVMYRMLFDTRKHFKAWAGNNT